MVWEVATAVAGRLLGINPFDQPDVESAKVADIAYTLGGGTAQPTTEAQVVEALMNEYEVERQRAAADVAHFAALLRENDLLAE